MLQTVLEAISVLALTGVTVSLIATFTHDYLKQSAADKRTLLIERILDKSEIDFQAKLREAQEQYEEGLMTRAQLVAKRQELMNGWRDQIEQRAQKQMEAEESLR